MCHPQRHKHPQSTSVKCRQCSPETAINEQMEGEKKHSTKLIYPLEQNVGIRYMPKGIYYFNVPLWLDDVRILILKPCCTLKSANLIGKSPPLIKHCLLFVVVAFLICAWKEGCGKHFLQQLLFCCKNLFLHWDKKKRGWNIVLMPRCVMPY